MKVLLCADSESLLNPEYIGLDGEILADQQWLMSCSSASVARVYARDCIDLAEIWVVSSDSMGGINLAAALKRESPQARIFLVSDKKTGSLISRSRAAGIDAVISIEGFLKAYYSAKETYGGVSHNVVSEGIDSAFCSEKNGLEIAKNGSNDLEINKKEPFVFGGT